MTIPPMSWEDYVIGAGVQIILWPPEPPYSSYPPHISAQILHQLFHVFGCNPALIVGYS